MHTSRKEVANRNTLVFAIKHQMQKQGTNPMQDIKDEFYSYKINT